MKKRVRIYQKGGSLQPQQQGPSPEQIMQYVSQMMASPQYDGNPETIMNELVQSGIDPQMAQAVIEQVLATEPAQQMMPQNEEMAARERLQSLYATDESATDTNIPAENMMRTGGVKCSKKKYVNDYMKLAKKQAGGQADNTDIPDGRNKKVDGFISSIKQTANEAKLREQAEALYEQQYNNPFEEEQGYFQTGGQARRAVRQASRMVPPVLAGQALSQFIGPNIQLANIDVRRSGMFGRPKEYTINFDPIAQPVTNAAEAAEAISKATKEAAEQAEMEKQNAKSNAKEAKDFEQSKRTSTANSSKTKAKTAPKKGSETDVETYDGVDVENKSGDKLNTYLPENWGPQNWNDPNFQDYSNPDLYNKPLTQEDIDNNFELFKNSEYDDPLSQASMMRRINSQPQAAHADDELIQMLVMGAGNWAINLGKKGITEIAKNLVKRVGPAKAKELMSGNSLPKGSGPNSLALPGSNSISSSNSFNPFNAYNFNPGSFGPNMGTNPGASVGPANAPFAPTGSTTPYGQMYGAEDFQQEQPSNIEQALQVLQGFKDGGNTINNLNKFIGGGPTEDYMMMLHKMQMQQGLNNQMSNQRLSRDPLRLDFRSPIRRVYSTPNVTDANGNPVTNIDYLNKGISQIDVQKTSVFGRPKRFDVSYGDTGLAPIYGEDPYNDSTSSRNLKKAQDGFDFQIPDITDDEEFADPTEVFTGDQRRQQDIKNYRLQQSIIDPQFRNTDVTEEQIFGRADSSVTESYDSKLKIDPAGLYSTATAGANAFNAIAEGMDDRKREKQMMDRITNPEFIYGVKETSDKGDYDMNSGLFRPDQTGNMRNAQIGGELNEEVYMTDEEIEEFLANGGQLEYL
jgi:hypothetical protein